MELNLSLTQISGKILMTMITQMIGNVVFIA